MASYARALALKPDYAEARLGLAMAVISHLRRERCPKHAEQSKNSHGPLMSCRPGLQPIPESWGRPWAATSHFIWLTGRWMSAASLSRYGDLVSRAATAHWPRDVRAIRTPARARSLGRGERPSSTTPGVGRCLARHHCPSRSRAVRNIPLPYGLDNRRRNGLGKSPCGSLRAWPQADQSVAATSSLRICPMCMFYPEVGMDPATFALAALRLAPLQIAGWGHPVTTGLADHGFIYLGRSVGRASSRTAVSRKAYPVARNRRLHGIAHRPIRSRGTLRTGRETVCASLSASSPSSSIRRTTCWWPGSPRHVGPSEFWLASPQQAHLDRGKVARSAGCGFPSGRARSGRLSARDAVAAAPPNFWVFWMRWMSTWTARPFPATRPLGRPFIAVCRSSLWKGTSCANGWRRDCCGRSACPEIDRAVAGGVRGDCRALGARKPIRRSDAVAQPPRSDPSRGASERMATSRL